MVKIAHSLPTRRGLPLALLIFVLVIGLGAYIGTLGNPLMFPARWLTSLNPQVAGNAGLVSIWTEGTPVRDPNPTMYRPVLLTGLRLQWKVWGESPSSFHAFNLLLFLSSVFVLLLLAGRLTSHPGARLAAALVMMLHPMASQAVLGIEGQGALLALPACLLASLALLNGRDGTWRPRTAGIAIVAAQAVAIGSHELGAVLPVWLIVLWLTGAGARSVASGVETAAAARRKTADEEADGVKRAMSPAMAAVLTGLATVIVLAGYGALRVHALGELLPDAARVRTAWEGIEVEPRRLAPAVFLLAWRRLVWPVSPTLVYEPAVQSDLLGSTGLGWGVLIGALIAAGIAWRRWRLLSVGIALAVSATAALSHWVPLPIFFAETPLVFALPGLGLMVGAVVEKLAGRDPVIPLRGWRGRATATAVVALAAALGWQTSHRSGQWSSQNELWRHEAALHPGSATPRIKLIDGLARGGEFDAALEAARTAKEGASNETLDRIAEYEALIFGATDRPLDLRKLLEGEIDSERKHRPGHMNALAIAARNQKWMELAEDCYRKELSQRPTDFEANFELSKLEFNRRAYESALDYVTRAANAARPEDRVPVYTQRAETLLQMGHLDTAEKSYLEILKIDPNFYPPYISLVRIYWGRKDYARAEATISAAFDKLNLQTYAELAGFYILILKEQGRGEEALNWLRSRSRVYTNDVPFQLLTAETLVKNRDYEHARDIYNALRGGTPSQRVEVLIGQAKIAHDRDRDSKRAIEYARQAQKIDPRHPAVLELLRRLGATSTPQGEGDGTGGDGTGN
jgi:tetratricopeptide (TPR) repeat protein